MKVLVVTNLYPPHGYGGYELSCQDVVTRWRDRGHEVTVLTTTARRADIGAAAPDAGVLRTLHWYWEDNELVRPGPLARWRLERHNQRALTGALDAVAPDVVSLWAMGGMSMALITRCVRRGERLAAVIEDDWLTYGAKVDPWAAAWSRRSARARRAAALLSGVPTELPALPAAVPVGFASEFLHRRADQHGMIAGGAREIVPLGIDTTDFPVRGVRDRRWRGTLLCVGRIEPRKGFEAVVRALPDLPNTTLQLVGPGDGHLRDLMGIAAGLGVAERISASAVPRDRLAAVYAAADVCVFPSRWDEPFGLVPLEAMSQATPVIATRRGGSAEFLVDGENCLEIPVDDPAAVVAAVNKLEASPDLRRRLASEGIRTAKRYDVARFADGLEAMHLRAAGGAG